MNQYAWLLILGLALVVFLLLVGGNKPPSLVAVPEFKDWDIYTTLNSFLSPH